MQIRKLIDSGHTNQILVSHDAVPYVYTDYATSKNEIEGWSYDPVDFTVCSTILIDELKKAGCER
ncbi:MAG: hypothetical protein R3C11_23355 [Planctomycetaceae bacterium]